MSTAVYVLISVPTEEREGQLKGDVPTLSTATATSDPESETTGFPLKKLLEESLRELGIVDAVWYSNKSGRGYQVCFPCDLETSDSIIEFFTLKKFGSLKETSIGYEAGA